MAKKENTVKKKLENTKPTEQEYYIYQLREHCRELFGVKPEVLDGALFNYTSTKITKSQAKSRIDKFLGKKIKNKKEAKQ